MAKTGTPCAGDPDSISRSETKNDMKKISEFLSLDEAVDQVAHDHNHPRFSVGRLKKLVATGKLDIYFFYRGALGLFAKPNVTPEGGISSNVINPVPSKKYYFVGHLRSISKPQLDVETTQFKVDPNTKRGITTSITSDILRPLAVIPVDGDFDDPAIKTGDTGEDYYWGRVKDRIGVQPTMLEYTSTIPIDKWLIHSDELRAVFLTNNNKGRIAQTSAGKPNEPARNVGASGGEPWTSKARNLASEIIMRQRAKDLYPNQIDIADEISRKFRLEGVVGSDNKPLSGAYIKRHALNGISSAVVKQLSTKTGRGK